MVETVLSIVSTVVLTLLGLYFLVSRQRQGTHLVFFLFCLLLALTEVFDRLSLNLNPSYRLYAMAAESLLPGTILLLSIMHSRKDPFNVNFFMKLMLVTSIAFPVSIFLIKGNGFYFAPDLQTEGMVFLTDQGYYFYLAMMFYFILALINLEATFVASRGSERWRLKFLFMGLVCIIAMEILYTSQALLYRTLNLNILPSRSVVFILGAILIGYSKLFRGNNVAISVSRTVLYRSLALLAVGVYLILLGALGEGLKYTGINYSENLLLIFGFIAGVAVLTVLFSEQVRRRIRVFINKHFYSHKHDYRNQWLNFTERLSKCRTSEEISRAIVETFKETFGLKWTALFVLDREEGIYKPLYPANGLTGVSLPGESPMIGYFKEKKRVFNSDSREYIPDERESAFIKERDAFLIIPLHNNGDVEGLVLCGEQIIREELTFEDYDLMKTLAKQATLSLINQRLSEELARTRQLAAVAKLSSFVIHDLKNMASSLSLVIENAKEYINEPEFQQDLLNT
ncbi:MAG: PEP-CTERM system histidine kinase PrsK, partial [Nitrospirae bacterium]